MTIHSHTGEAERSERRGPEAAGAASRRAVAGRARDLSARAAARAHLLLPALLTAALALRAGGFFAGAPAVLAIVMAVLLVARITLVERPWSGWSPPLAVSAGALALLAGWTLVSAAWSHAPARAMIEFDRTLAYVLVLAFMGSFVPRTGDLDRALRLVALAIGAIAAAALLDAPVPGDLPDRRGALAGAARLPAHLLERDGRLLRAGHHARAALLGRVAARSRRPRAGGGLPARTATALYFTFSRGGIAVAAARGGGLHGARPPAPPARRAARLRRAGLPRGPRRLRRGRPRDVGLRRLPRPGARRGGVGRGRRAGGDGAARPRPARGPPDRRDPRDAAAAPERAARLRRRRARRPRGRVRRRRPARSRRRPGAQVPGRHASPTTPTSARGSATSGPTGGSRTGAWRSTPSGASRCTAPARAPTGSSGSSTARSTSSWSTGTPSTWRRSGSSGGRGSCCSLVALLVPLGVAARRLLRSGAAGARRLPGGRARAAGPRRRGLGLGDAGAVRVVLRHAPGWSARRAAGACGSARRRG